MRLAILRGLPLVLLTSCANTGSDSPDHSAKNLSEFASVVHEVRYSVGDPDLLVRPFHLRPGANLPATTPPQAMTCMPAPCALPNVDVSVGTTMPVNETPVAVNPVNHKELITGGNDYNCNTRFLGFWTSADGGKTWSGGCVRSLSGAQLAGDPILGYDLNGTVYQGGVNYLSDSYAVVVVASSTNNGRTWGKPVKAVYIAEEFADKPWLAIDTNPRSPNRNNLYISNTMYSTSGTTIYVTTSKDGGKTWSSVSASGEATGQNLYQTSDLAIGSDGTVYLSYVGCTYKQLGDCSGSVATMYLQKSTDAGATWSAPVVMDAPALAPGCNSSYELFGCLPNTKVIVSNVPAIGIDNSGGPHNGNLYLADYNWSGSYMQVQVRTSKDGGNSWSAAVPVAPDSDTHDQFFQWLSVAPDGKVGVTWMDRRNDPANLSYQAFATWSGDGGNSFNTHNVRIGKKFSNPDNDGFGGTFVGDYTGNAWMGNEKLLATWTDTRNGSFAQDYIGGVEIK